MAESADATRPAESAKKSPTPEARPKRTGLRSAGKSCVRADIFGEFKFLPPRFLAAAHRISHSGRAGRIRWSRTNWFNRPCQMPSIAIKEPGRSRNALSAPFSYDDFAGGAILSALSPTQRTGDVTDEEERSYYGAVRRGSGWWPHKCARIMDLLGDHSHRQARTVSNAMRIIASCP